MEGIDRVIKHLEMIQGVINRFGNNSFLIKGWSMAILAAGVLFLARSTCDQSAIILTFVIPVVGFWILDGYFLYQERLFRKLYNKVRKQRDTDFSMKTKKHKKPICNFLASMFSITLRIFYVVEILFVLFIYIICFYQRYFLSLYFIVN